MIAHENTLKLAKSKGFDLRKRVPVTIEDIIQWLRDTHGLTVVAEQTIIKDLETGPLWSGKIIDLRYDEQVVILSTGDNNKWLSSSDDAIELTLEIALESLPEVNTKQLEA
jgi:hypothetical protein